MARPLDFHRFDLSIADLLARATAVGGSCAANAEAIDRDGTFPEAEFIRLAETGLLIAPLRAELGGLGLGSEPGGTLPLLRILQRVGRGNLAVGRLYEGHVNALLLIQQFGTPDQARRWAADARRGHRFAVWNTEAADGVRFEPAGAGRWRMVGAKTFASGTDSIGRPIVPGAMPDGGWRMAVVDGSEIGRERVEPGSWTATGMRASASGRVDFTGIEIGADDFLGESGDYRTEPQFSGGAIRFAAVQLGGAEALFAATRDHLVAAGRAGDPYQKARLGRIAILVEGGNHWLEAAARAAEDRRLGPEGIVAHAAMVRTAIAEIAEEVLALAERSVGVQGALRPHPIERIGRDLTTYLRQPGPDAALAAVGSHVAASGRDVAELWTTPADPVPLDEPDPIAELDPAALGPTLILAPHADDESLGTGGLIARLVDLGVPPTIVFVSDGTRSHPNSPTYPPPRLRAIREAEARAALAALGLEPGRAGAVTFLGLPDAAVPGPGESGFIAAVDSIASIARSMGARTIVAPWRRDPHCDHRAAWAMARAVARDARPPLDLLEYMIWAPTSPDPDDRPRPGEVAADWVDIRGVLGRKRAAIAAHRSQVTRLIDDDPSGFILSPEVLARFDRPWEIYLRGPA